jgi:glycosyltransferase involved in cell wall biosynthesis
LETRNQKARNRKESDIWLLVSDLLVSMRIAFLDRMPWDYRVDTPDERPLGGSQSALCHLASALAGQGHAVRLVTMTTAPGLVAGVDCRSLSEGFALFEGMDAAVVLNDPDPAIAAGLRAAMGGGGLVVLWTQHDVDQPAMAAFADAGVRAAWDRVVFVSDWQRRAYRRGLRAMPADIVIGNAMAPAFETLFGDDEDVLAAKAGPPLLVYASAPFRGLDVLLDAFPLIRARLPAARLLVHSSLGIYQVEAAADAHQALYARCRAMPGVDYRGAVAQPDLAQALRRALCFAYPSTFPETFCTAALEGMAAGCLAVLGDLGALAETTRGLAELVAPGEDYAGRFAQRVVAALADREALGERLSRQRRLLAASASWTVRARAWEGFLGQKPETSSRKPLA